MARISSIAALVLLALVGAAVAASPALAAAVNSGAKGDRTQTSEVKRTLIFVPIDEPAIELAPPKKSTAVKQAPRSTAAQASEAIAKSVEVFPKVPFVELGSTDIPLWWVFLVALAVPLARMWRGWTASMFT